MRRIRWGWGIASLAALSLAAGAQAGGQHDEHAGKMEHEGHMMGQGSESMTVEGEIVDLGCYLGHGAKGAKHKSCATKCIAGGMPMGLLTQDGTLYLLTMSHEDADPFNAAKDLAAETVKVTGPVHERDGMLSLEVTALESAGTGS